MAEQAKKAAPKRKTTAKRKPAAKKTAARKPAAKKPVTVQSRVTEAGRNAFLANLGLYGMCPGCFNGPE